MYNSFEEENKTWQLGHSVEYLDLLIGLEYCIHFFIHSTSDLFSLIGKYNTPLQNKSTMQVIWIKYGVLINQHM